MITENNKKVTVYTWDIITQNAETHQPYKCYLSHIFFFNNNYTCDVNSSKEGSKNNSKKIEKIFILLNFIDFLEMGHLRFGTSQPGLIKVAGLKQIKIVKLVKQSHLAN